MKQIKLKEWINYEKGKKYEAIKNVMNSWRISGEQLNCDEEWFYKALEAAYNATTEDELLYKTMSMLAIMGNAIDDKKRNEKIQQLMKNVTDLELKIFNNVSNIAGNRSLSDEEFNTIIKNVSKEFNISSEEVYRAWDKVDKARLGLDF